MLLYLLACQTISGTDFANLGQDCSKRACVNGLTCSQAEICLEDGESGTYQEGEDCSATDECANGLVCSGENLCATPGSPGTAGDGKACTEEADCASGHYCGDDGLCHDLQIPYWESDACPADDPDNFRAIFEVPRLPASGQIDFFALPFPNDIRRDTSKHPDLSGFPLPPDSQAQELLDAIQAEVVDFGRNPTVYFRFSQAVDSNSLKALADDATIHWAVLDGPGYGERSSLRYFYRTGRGRYICQNWLAVSTYEGEMLPTESVVAVYLTKGIKSKGGKEAGREEAFEKLLASDRPDNVGMGLAWDAYAPFREYIADQGIEADNILSAAVFSTGDPGDILRSLDDSAIGNVELKDMVRCAAGAQGPCDVACDAPPAGMEEIQGHLSLSLYRNSDGKVELDSFGRPVVQGSEDACFSLTLPAGVSPTNGWPVAILAQEEGRDFREASTQGIAVSLATEGWGSLTLALPGQSGRSGGTTPSDPLRMRSELVQRAADLHAAIEAIRSLNLSESESPTGVSLRVDGQRLYLVAHGQGGIGGASAMSWSPYLKGGVVGNVPGVFALWMPEAIHPVDYRHGLMTALGDSSVDVHHPLVSLLQLYLEPVETTNNAGFLFRDPQMEALHMLSVDGVADDSLPRESLQAMLRALDAPIVGTVLDDYGQGTATAPASENVSTADGRRTAGSVQVQSGHEALFDGGGATTADFLGSSSANAPTINP